VLALPAAAILRALGVYILRRVDGLRPDAAVAGLLPGAGPAAFDFRAIWNSRFRRG
jgi:hypothetical protein